MLSFCFNLFPLFLLALLFSLKSLKLPEPFISLFLPLFFATITEPPTSLVFLLLSLSLQILYFTSFFYIYIYIFFFERALFPELSLGAPRRELPLLFPPSWTPVSLSQRLPPVSSSFFFFLLGFLKLSPFIFFKTPNIPEPSSILPFHLTKHYLPFSIFHLMDPT